MHADNQSPLFPIGKVEKMTGLTGRQIRYYEDKGLISPYRTKGNQRRFSRADINRLRKIKELVKQGLDLETVREQLEKSETAGKDSNPDLQLEQPFDETLPDERHLKSLYPVSDRAKLVEILTSFGDTDNTDDGGTED